MHLLQKELIKRLITKNGLKFSELANGYDAENNIVFHIKQLITQGYLTKRDDHYFLTPKGVNARSSFELSTLEDTSVKSFFVGFACKSGNDYLIKPHMTIDNTFYNLPSGKPSFGENLNEALPRLFYEETSVTLNTNDFKFDSLHLKTVKTESGDILFDDAFTVYTVTVDNATRDAMDLKKGCVWQSIDSIEALENKWPEIDLVLLRKDWSIYKVYDVVCNYVISREDI